MAISKELSQLASLTTVTGTTTTIAGTLLATNISGTNTGDQVLPTLSSLGAQATLVSGTSIKTINGSTLLGSGDLTLASSTPTLTISNKTANYTIVAGDNGTVINYATGTFTLTLTTAATLGTGFNVRLNNQGTGVITVATNGTNKIAGSTTSLIINAGSGYFIFSDGVDFFVNATSPFGVDGVTSTQVGSGANALSTGVAVGYNANGSYTGVALGGNTNGSSSGVAIGYNANGSSSGAAVGFYATAQVNGAVVGYFASGSSNGAAVGYYADGTNAGAAVGRNANGSSIGVAVGYAVECHVQYFVYGDIRDSMMQESEFPCK